MRSVLAIRALVSPTTAILLGALFSSIGGRTVFAETVSSTTCPPGFSCVKPYPQDGACQHPAIVLDEKAKTGSYASDPYSRASEKACIAKTKSLTARRGGELRLKLANGAMKLYKDNQTKAACAGASYESCKSYMLYDYFPEHGLLLVHVMYYESDEWLLVRQQDGRQEQIVAPPRYSPDRKWLASVFWTDGPSDGNNGIDILPASGESIEQAFHYRSEGYELWEYVGWESDDRLSVKVTWRVGSDPELATWPAEVVRVNGKWQLHRWPPNSSRP
ncbi:hypothetical protein JQ604_30690 [Bradyrhizobium jicamae]|uniref:hypothetical protein n=1 Tax=Bradyrhizobium jicamae TaxID=280332 RepID=UPI001BAD16F4|nr:hypothetical protein [Bradyrhizobium jicamae]MBR0756568.1 hypothetical protein [Bradyrhizobium jicamae]